MALLRLTNCSQTVGLKEIVENRVENKRNMKPKQGSRGKRDPLRKLSEAETAAVRRYRSKLVKMLDDVERIVHEVPAEVDIPRKSIEGFLVAAFYLLYVNDGLGEMDD